MAALLLCAGSLWAQTLEIEKPLALTERQEAVKYERLDFNQVPCALLILHLDNDNVDFEGDIRTTQYRNGEWWIWMIQGSNWLTVKASQFTPLTMEFKGLQSGKTYEATVRAAVLLRLAISEDFHFDQSRTDAANAKYMRRDAQGRTCALVRMGLVLPEAQITGPQVEHSEYRDGEWWVWLSPDATQMTVTADGYQPLALQFDPVRAASTYMLTLLKEGQRAPQRYKWEKVPEGFVDLGLPSSTLWAEDNWSDRDGETYHFDWDYFVERGFGPLMPSQTMMNELMTECKWTWIGKGYKVVGPNGNFIMLPADGFYTDEANAGEWAGATQWKGFPEEFGKVGAIWTSTPAGRFDGWAGGFSQDTIAITDEFSTSYGLSIRFILTPEIGQGKKVNYPKVEESSTAKHIYPHMMASSSNEKTHVEDDEVVELVISDDPDITSDIILVSEDDTEIKTDLGNIDATNYVDLGLPSGTLWRVENESGEYEYDAAVKTFGNFLPSKEQWEEMKNYCKVKRVNGHFKVTGPNGNTITFLETSFGRYWSRTSAGYGNSWCMEFDGFEDKMEIEGYGPNHSISVRLVVPSGKTDGYVDLGLPSGTKWKLSSESDYYDYNAAVKKYGKQMPTKEQWEELKDNCKWEWNEDNNSVRITGPNGKNILMFAEGRMDCDEDDLYENGYYWSRTNMDKETAWYLYFDTEEEKVSVNKNKQCRRLPVWLVKSK